MCVRSLERMEDMEDMKISLVEFLLNVSVCFAAAGQLCCLARVNTSSEYEYDENFGGAAVAHSRKSDSGLRSDRLL